MGRVAAETFVYIDGDSGYDFDPPVGVSDQGSNAFAVWVNWAYTDRWKSIRWHPAPPAGGLTALPAQEYFAATCQWATVLARTSFC
jgi:hypothetical protein